MGDANFWNERYNSTEEFAYGREPNVFLVEFIESYFKAPAPAQPLRALCLCDGEGRNSIYLAKKGFEVTAMDFSEVGMRKLDAWAAEEGLKVCTFVEDLETFEMGLEQWDLVVSIFAHVPPDLRKKVHGKAVACLRPGGLFLFEAYHPDNVGRGTGGPQSAALCATREGVLAEIAQAGGLDLLKAEELELQVDEGRYHSGLAAVTQVIARKG